MRRAFFVACASLAVAAVVACATSADEPLPPGPDPQPSPISDGGTVDTDDDGSSPIRDASSRDGSCSEGGWCITALPDRDLVLKDIWPFESRAFAIAESRTLGIKVLEWDETAKTWSYIDDNSQNEYGFGQFAGKIWAPNENEVYYGSAPSFIYRGVRATPSSPWSWQRERLGDNSRDPVPAHDHGLGYYYHPNSGETAIVPALGVWGTSADHVYAWYANTIFHRKSEDGGAPAWVAEYILEDVDALADTTYVFSASGSSPDDVWFAGGRIRYDATGTKPPQMRDYACPVVIHKTAQGYGRIVDAVIDENASYTSACGQKPGTVPLEDTLPLGSTNLTSSWEHIGWLTSAASAGHNAMVGILEGNALAYVTSEDGGLARRNVIANLSVPSTEFGALLLSSVSVHDAHAWASGWGLILQIDNNPGAWSTGRGLRTPKNNAVDSGTYTISSSVLNGVPIDVPLHQVRGTSNNNLWAIGARYALHKTTTP
jgi:hypothetical protein